MVDNWNIGVFGKLRAKCFPLLNKHLPCQFGVFHRVTETVADELVVLDQPVVWVGGKGERREVEGINGRLGKQG